MRGNKKTNKQTKKKKEKRTLIEVTLLTSY